MVLCFQVELEELEHELNEESCSSLEDDVDSLFGDLLTSSGVTEWQVFLSNNLEIVAKVADLYPDKIFALLVSVWEASLSPNERAMFARQKASLSLRGTLFFIACQLV